MFRHEDVTEDMKIMAPAKLFERFEEDSAAVIVVEIRKTMKATKSDEVVVAEGVMAFETARHETDHT